MKEKFRSSYANHLLIPDIQRSSTLWQNIKRDQNGPQIPEAGIGTEIAKAQEIGKEGFRSEKKYAVFV